MIIYYNKNYNIDLGLINKLHPFDGLKFKKVVKNIANLPEIVFESPSYPITHDEVNAFVDSFLKVLVTKKRYVLRALELPYIPLVPFVFIDNRILNPMRWGVAGTLAAARKAFEGNNCWNLSGGYHHASAANSEGFCIYNDIGITLRQMRKQNHLHPEEKILIIDIDAHHGNGNAYTFLKDKSVTLFDIYNDDIYPTRGLSKERVDINVPLRNGTEGKDYLEKLSKALDKISGEYKLAFVIAGTDVLYTDPLGGLRLTIDETVERDKLVFEKLNFLSIPAVFLGGGGYSKESSIAISSSIKKLYRYY